MKTKPFYTTTHLSKILGVTPGTIWRAVHTENHEKRILAYFTRGGQARIPLKEVERILKSKKKWRKR